MLHTPSSLAREASDRHAEPAAPAVQSFSFGPFLLQSDFDLPALRTVPRNEAATRQVRICRGAVGSPPAEAVPCGGLVWAAPQFAQMHLPDKARFRVENGNHVTIDAAHDAAEMDIASYILGWVFGVLCHQNGFLPLHASAVEQDGRVTAFVGDSGAGKSTLAACLERRGLPVVSDDICLLAPDGRSVVAVAGWLKLWRTSLQFLGRDARPEDQTFTLEDKYRVQLAQPAPPHALRLVRLLFLLRDENVAAEPRMERMAAPEAVAAMLRMVYLGYMVEAMGTSRQLFLQCAVALGEARSYRLCAPWGLETLDRVAAFAERIVRTGAADDAQGAQDAAQTAPAREER